MSEPTDALVDRFMDGFVVHQRRNEVLFWMLYLFINNTVGALTTIADHARAGLSLDSWEAYCWEYTSGIAMLLLIPLVVLANRQFPLTPSRLGPPLLAHGLFSVVFSLLHVVAMVGMRKLVYLVNNRTYDFGNWPVELVYEYRKDLRTYITILVLIYLYRYLRRRHRGEARLLSEPPQTPASAVPERFLVRKRGREFVVQVADIDWVEAAGNYVNLHVAEAVYPLRETMRRMADQLPGRFARVHRSAIVNLDRIAEIRPLPSGDHRIKLASGVEVNFSRRYRDQVKDRIAEVSTGG